MAFASWGIVSEQQELGRQLGTRPGIGTPFFHLTRLTAVHVSLDEWGGLDKVAAALDAGQAVIVGLVTTPGLPGWDDVRTQHAVLVVDVGDEQVHYHDPALAEGPVGVVRGEFALAWAETGEMAAFLTRN